MLKKKIILSQEFFSSLILCIVQHWRGQLLISGSVGLCTKCQPILQKMHETNDWRDGEKNIRKKQKDKNNPLKHVWYHKDLLYIFWIFVVVDKFERIKKIAIKKQPLTNEFKTKSTVTNNWFYHHNKHNKILFAIYSTSLIF